MGQTTDLADPLTTRVRTPRTVLVLGAGVLAVVAYGVGLDRGDFYARTPVGEVNLTGLAVEACMSSATDLSGLPADPSRTTIEVTQDHQGWWDVRVQAAGYDRSLQCTVVPDGNGGVRAASWGSDPVG